MLVSLPFGTHGYAAFKSAHQQQDNDDKGLQGPIRPTDHSPSLGYIPNSAEANEQQNEDNKQHGFRA